MGIAWAACALVAGSAVSQIPFDDPEGGPPYLGAYEIGLYRDGQNVAPPAHHAEGLRRANLIAPLDTNGNPDPVNGKIVMMSIGMSNTMIPFCTAEGDLPVRLDPINPSLVQCYPWSFMSRTRNAGTVFASSQVQIVNGAYVGQPARVWTDDAGYTFDPIPPNPSIPSVVGNYSRVRDMVMPRYTPVVTEAQVQIVWLKIVNGTPVNSLPAADADTYLLLERIGTILRFMSARYPNLSMVFVTSASWRGYSSIAFNPEPHAYETGFAVKWAIEAQIHQMETGGAAIDPIAGDLDYAAGIAPWIVWGPYIWAQGTSSRHSDGLSWMQFDYAPDGVHHDAAGQSKFSLLLLRFFTFSPYTHCWFLADGACE